MLIEQTILPASVLIVASFGIVSGLFLGSSLIAFDGVYALADANVI